MNYIWSEDNSLFHMDMIQVILAVKMSTDLSCEAFSKNLVTDSEVLKYIVEINTMPLQEPPLQSNNDTNKIIVSYILHYYAHIITFTVSVHRLVH
jgi:hypothetical protein